LAIIITAGIIGLQLAQTTPEFSMEICIPLLAIAGFEGQRQNGAARLRPLCASSSLFAVAALRKCGRGWENRNRPKGSNKLNFQQTATQSEMKIKSHKLQGQLL